MFPCHFVWQCQPGCQKYSSPLVDFSADQFRDMRFLIIPDCLQSKKGIKIRVLCLMLASRVWIGTVCLSRRGLFKNRKHCHPTHGDFWDNVLLENSLAGFQIWRYWFWVSHFSFWFLWELDCMVLQLSNTTAFSFKTNVKILVILQRKYCRARCFHYRNIPAWGNPHTLFCVVTGTLRTN